MPYAAGSRLIAVRRPSRASSRGGTSAFAVLGRILPLASFLLSLAVAAAVQAGEGTGPAFSCGSDTAIDRGQVAEQDVVVCLADLEVLGTAERDVAVVGGTVTVQGEVRGSVIALGGSVRLGAESVVSGDVVCVGGGGVRRAEGSEVGGRVVTFGSPGELFGGGTGEGKGLLRSLRWHLVLLLGWLVVTLLVSLSFPGQVVMASGELGRRPLRNGLVGLLGLLALSLSLGASLLLSIILIGIPLFVIFLIAGLLLKMFGLVAVFHLSGSRLLRRAAAGSPNPVAASLLGFFLIGLIRLIPWVGGWIWLLASILGFGVSLATKFGTGLPWFRAGNTGQRDASIRPS